MASVNSPNLASAWQDAEKVESLVKEAGTIVYPMMFALWQIIRVLWAIHAVLLSTYNSQPETEDIKTAVSEAMRNVLDERG